MGLWKFLNKPILGTGRAYEFRWREPWLMRLKLHGDFPDRFAMSVACCLALAAAAYAIALNEVRPAGMRPEVELAAFLGFFVGAMVSLGIFMAPEALFGGGVTVKEDRLLRVRETMSVWHGLHVREWWRYPDLVCSLVPGQALGTPFSVLALPTKSKARLGLVSVPPHVDLEQVVRYLAARGVKVQYAPQLADRVRSQRPYARPFVGCVVIALLAVTGVLSVYGGVKYNRLAQAGAWGQPAPAAGPAERVRLLDLEPAGAAAPGAAVPDGPAAAPADAAPPPKPAIVGDDRAGAAPAPVSRGDVIARAAAAPGGPAPGASSSPPVGLKYAWKVGNIYTCSFTLEATIGDLKPRINGSVSFQPTEGDPAALGREKAEVEGSGTAFVVTPEGVLVTCAHVVRGTTRITAHFGQKAYPAKVIAFDGPRDLALVKIEASGLPALALGDSDQVQLGQDVRAIGYPLSDVLGESVKITRGTIAGIVQRKDEKLLQIDASVNPGNSGGPLVDAKGRVVGVASALLTGEEIDRVGFAIPASEAAALLKRSGVQPAAAPAGGPDLDGPELARRTTPSVALLKVKLGRGGIGTSPPTLVRYYGSYRISLGDAQRSLPGSSPFEEGRMLVDALGRIESFEGPATMPLGVDSLGKIGIELLPEEGQRQWKSSRMVTLTERVGDSTPGDDLEEDDSPFGVPGRSSFGPPRRKPFGPPGYYGPPGYRGKTRPGTPSRPSREPKVTFHPALEVIRYELGDSAEDGTVTIRKQYELTTLDAKQGEPTFEMKGSGTVTWDTRLGIPAKAEFRATQSSTSKNVTVRVPMTVTYAMVQTDASRTVRPDSASPGAPRAGRDRSQPDQPPVRKVEPPATADKTPEPEPGSVRKVAPGGGLKLEDE